VYRGMISSTERGQTTDCPWAAVFLMTSPDWL